MIPEEAILAAVQELLTGEVNAILAHIEEEESDEACCPSLEVPSGFSALPSRPGHFDLSIAQAENEEKDRIVKVSRYGLTISVEASGRFPAMQCYRYAAAVERALQENPTLGGVASYVSVTRKNYAFPKTLEGGEPHRLTLTVTVCREAI